MLTLIHVMVLVTEHMNSRDAIEYKTVISF